MIATRQRPAFDGREDESWLQISYATPSDIRHQAREQALYVSLLGLGIVVFVIGILYSVQTWRFPRKKLSHKRTRMAQGDSLFMVVLGIAIISVGLYL